MQAEYQFLHFNSSGIIDRAERLRLVDDDDALARARAAAADTRIEVWDGRRRVGVVPPRLFNGTGAASAHRRGVA